MKWQVYPTITFLLFTLWSTHGCAEDQPLTSSAHVDYISDFQEDQQLLINSKITIHLSKAMHSAIQHEIPIRFKTSIILSQNWPILGFNFYHEQTDRSYETELRYVKYTRTYALTNFRNHQRRSFTSLKDALYTLGIIEGFPITELVHLHPGEEYQLKICLSIVPWKLPAPLIITALTAQDWQLNASCLTHHIKAPTSW